MDITGPLFWWKELDTYKIGTVANSTSTMHKLAETPITLDCFEYPSDVLLPIQINDFIKYLESMRQKYLETKDKKYWKEIVSWLPLSWKQTRTWTANYEVLRSIYHQRKNHKLTEWHTFCDFIKTLPYANELIIGDE